MVSLVPYWPHHTSKLMKEKMRVFFRIHKQYYLVKQTHAHSIPALPTYPGPLQQPYCTTLYVLSIVCTCVFELTLWTGVSGVLTSAGGSLLLETPVWPAGAAWLCLLYWAGHAVSGGVSTLSYQFSMQLVPPVMVSLLLSLEAVPLLAWQYTALRSIRPGFGNALEVCGVLAILAGNAVGPAYDVYAAVRGRREG